MIGFCLIAVIPKLLSLGGGNELEFQGILSKFWTRIPVILNLYGPSHPRVRVNLLSGFRVNE